MSATFDRLEKLIRDQMPGGRSEDDFSTWDIALAVWHYCNEWHGGQWSDEYRMLCAVPIGGNIPDIEDNEEETTAQMVYDWLTADDNAKAKELIDEACNPSDDDETDESDD